MASVYAVYLRSHFSVSQPNALRSRVRGYPLSSPEPRALSSLTRPFALLSLLLNLLRLPPIFPSSTATGPEKAAYPMLKHLPRSGMDFLLHIFNLFWILHFFSSIWKTSSIIPIHNMGKPFDSPASFRPISLIHCVSRSLIHCVSTSFFCLKSNFILTPRQTGVRPGQSTLDQIFSFSVHLGWV